MRNADEEKNIASRIKEGLKKRNGRLFFAESDKPSAAAALASIISDLRETFVCVVRDGDVAKDFSDAFKNKYIETTLVSSGEQLASLLEGIGASARTEDSALRALAPGFKEKYPYLIITIEDSAGKGSVFHKKLADDTTKKGSFAAPSEGEYVKSLEKSAPFCVSDLLACAGYGFAIVDDIYGAFDFYEAKEKKPHPFEAESVDFFGTQYFADTAHSHRRLKALVQSCRQAVLLSDYTIKDSILSFYAALDLLDDGFSFSKEEKRLASLDPDYANTDYYDQVVANMFGPSDETMERLARLVVGKKKGFRSMNDLENYIFDRLFYRSSYEIYIKAFAPFVERSIHTAVERIFGEESVKAADCYMKLFFEDALKEEIENAISSVHVSELSSEAVKALLNIFSRYGTYSPCEAPKSAVLLEMYRDNSGYEAYLEGLRTERKAQKEAQKKKNKKTSAAANAEEDFERLYYSAIHAGSDLMYGCALLQQLTEDGVSGKRLQFPVLVVTREDKQEFVRILEKILPKVKASVDYCDVSQASKSGIAVVVTDFERIAKSARRGNIRSALCLGTLADPLSERNLLQKLGVPAVVAVRYGDMSLALADFWSDTVFGKKGGAMLPVGSGEISLKSQRFDDYATVVENVGKVYGALQELISGSGGNPAKIAEQLNSLIIEFSTDGECNADEIARELGFLSKASKPYHTIFAESVSFGREGETLSRTDYAVPSSPKLSESGKAILFNACVKILRRACDTTKRTCAVCEEYKKYRKNSLVSFCGGVREFMKASAAYAKKSDELRAERAKNASLSYTEEKEKAITVEFVSEKTKAAEKILDELERTGKKFNGTFAYPAEGVQELKEIVTEIFERAANPALERLIEMFCEASQKVKIRKSGTIGE